MSINPARHSADWFLTPVPLSAGTHTERAGDRDRNASWDWEQERQRGIYTGIKTKILLVVFFPFNVYLHSSAFTEIIALCQQQFSLLYKGLNSDRRLAFQTFWNIFSFSSFHIENTGWKNAVTNYTLYSLYWDVCTKGCFPKHPRT